MATNTVTVSGMFGNDKTYFAESPVVIDIDGLYWGNPVTSPFTIVRVEVVHDGNVVGDFRADTGGQTSISFDISSALRAMWIDYGYKSEVARAQAATGGAVPSSVHRPARAYSIVVYAEFLDSPDNEFTTVCVGTFDGGQCIIGGLTELERSTVSDTDEADADQWEGSANNGSASTKPTGSPERVGRDSITSRVNVAAAGTTQTYYIVPISTQDTEGTPTVLRDSQPYVDFLFVNRRGAVETCSGLMFEGQNITVESQQYARVEQPKFMPSRSLMSIRQSGPRRAWDMSSGFVTREWAEWWAMEFLMARQWWMRYPIGSAEGKFVPVVVTPAKKSVGIYDRAKQQMPHVDFTVTLGLEG